MEIGGIPMPVDAFSPRGAQGRYAGSSAIRLHKPSDVRVRGSSSITSAKPFDQSGDLCSRKSPVIPAWRTAVQYGQSTAAPLKVDLRSASVGVAGAVGISA